MDDKKRTEAEVIAELATAVNPVYRPIGFSDLAIVYPGWNTVDLEKYNHSPRRIRRLTVLDDAPSMTEYLRQFVLADGSGSRLYANFGDLSMCAIIDDDLKVGASWRTHKALLSLKKSIEWNAWVGQNGKLQSQFDYCEFLEENISDIVEPSAAVILEGARSMTARKKVSFESGVRLETGDVQFSIIEETEARTRSCAIMPEAFTIGIPVFEGGERYAIKARMKYRMNDGFKIGYQLLGIERTIRTVFREVAQTIGKEAPITTLFGRAP